MGRLWSLISILNSGASRRENLNSPFGHKVNFRHVTSRKLRVKKWRSVKAFYSSPLIVVSTIRNTAVPFESIALSSLLSSTSTTPCSIFSDVCFNVRIAFYDVTSRPLTRNIETHSNKFVGRSAASYAFTSNFMESTALAFFCHGVQRSEVYYFKRHHLEFGTQPRLYSLS